MKLIIGLGNPDQKYLETRHNLGFKIADAIRKKWQLPEFQFNKKLEAEISKGQLDDQEILLAKPQTFMNNSGMAVMNILNFFKLSADDILVIHDDLDIDVGKYKIAVDSSSAGNNGVQDIIDRLGTQKFKRLRIGIGRNQNIPAEDYVLQKFSDPEKEIISNLIGNLTAEAEKIIKNKI
jgi:PTH1 family peptidyl-tRNA hydrolase